MKKLSLKNLNIEASELLQPKELKSVFGGYDGCGIYDIDFGWSYGWSVEDAQSLYRDFSDVTGCCCASC